MKGLSKKEIEVVAWLEFHEKYFFTSSDIERFAENKTQRYNIIKNLVRKKRIVKLNRAKYYLVPIKAKSGKWSENPFIVVDEICNSKDYFIGDWAASNYWRLTDQIPMRIGVYTTRRQGNIRILNTKIVFHRTSKKRLEKAVVKSIQGHTFRILSKKESKKWMKLRE
ncbi:MAG: hypothetical protein KJ613_04865 [Nanoarchaeota archaeon]|nr:hypothetical protein [Nanoarchaeota archaeon]